MRKKVAFISLGSNLGDRRENLKKALEYMEAHPEITIEKVSSFIESKPVGGPPQGDYLNGVVKINTTLSPYELLSTLKDIEKKLGRKRTIRFGPRTIDLDILLYRKEVIDEDTLKIPHPRMFEREFVLKPLFEIEPEMRKFICNFKKTQIRSRK